MQSILNNPYRIIGILSNTSVRELQNHKGKIQAFVRVSKQITSEYDFPFLNSINRTNTIIDKAFSDIEQNQNKVIHSLFWFININPIDHTAIQHLINGNKEKAIEIWEKLTDEKEVNAKNFSAFNNIGTLYLLENSKEKIKQGITAKIKLISSEHFKDFVHTVADETFSIDTNKQIELLIDEVLVQFKNKFSIAEIIDLFSSCTGTTQNYLSKKFTEEPVHKIEIQIEKAKNKRIKDKNNANRFAFDLYRETKSELKLIKSILGYKNLQYKMIADTVAKELLQCSIDYFNESQKQKKSIDYLKETLGVARMAEDIAIYNGTTKKKIQENIKTLEEISERTKNELEEIKRTLEKIRIDVNRLKPITYNALKPHIREEIDKKITQEFSRLYEILLTEEVISKIARCEDLILLDGIIDSITQGEYSRKIFKRLATNHPLRKIYKRKEKIFSTIIISTLIVGYIIGVYMTEEWGIALFYIIPSGVLGVLIAYIISEIYVSKAMKIEENNLN